MPRYPDKNSGYRSIIVKISKLKSRILKQSLSGQKVHKSRHASKSGEKFLKSRHLHGLRYPVPRYGYHCRLLWRTQNFPSLNQGKNFRTEFTATVVRYPCIRTPDIEYPVNEARHPEIESPVIECPDI